MPEKKTGLRALVLKDPPTKVYVGDCREILPKLKPASANLVFADPPYNIGVDYEGWDDAIGAEEYQKFTEQWLSLCVDQLTDDGSLFTYVPPQLANRIAVFLEDKLGMHFVNDICVVQRFGQNQLNRFVSGHRRLTYHCKDPDIRVWNIQDIMVASMRASHYKDARTMKKEEHKGERIPLDVWGWDEQYFGRIQGNNAERRPLHPNQVPEKVLERVINATTAKGDVVLDPFTGSGTTLAVARALGREGVGCEISEKFAKSAMSRIKKGAIRVHKTTK